MKNIEIKKHIEIEGVILTEDALNELRSLQQNNNEVLKISLKSVLEAIVFIAKLIPLTNGEESKKAALIEKNLNEVYESIQKLKKP